MQPLFQNRTTIGKAELLEWYKKELSGQYGGYRAINIALLVMCLGVAGWCLYIRSLLGGVWFVVGSVVMLALAVLVGLNLLFRPRLAVRAMLRKDKGQNYPTSLITQFFPEETVMLRLSRAAGQAGAAEAYIEKAAGIQRELNALMEEAQHLDTTGPAGLARLRDELTGLSAQMEALTGAGGLIEGEQRLAHTALTGYMQTKSLMVLYYDDIAVLLRRDGFAPGTEADFRRFLYDLLAAAAKAAQDKRVKKALLKALADYFIQDETQEEVQQ